MKNAADKIILYLWKYDDDLLSKVANPRKKFCTSRKLKTWWQAQYFVLDKIVQKNEAPGIVTLEQIFKKFLHLINFQYYIEIWDYLCWQDGQHTNLYIMFVYATE